MLIIFTVLLPPNPTHSISFRAFIRNDSTFLLFIPKCQSLQGAAIQPQQMGNSHADNGHLPVGNKSCHEPLMFFGRLVDNDEKDDQKAEKAILLEMLPFGHQCREIQVLVCI